MRQPKRTASRLLSALLGLIMLLSLLPTVALAAERVPEELKAMKVSSGVKDEVNFRDLVWNPPFREVNDKPVKFNGERRWVRWNETANNWESYTEGTFKEGKYKYFVEATISGQYYDQYQFANQVTATVNGTNWKTTGSAIDPGRKLSRILMVSPEYTIEGRQLVNRIVLTSNMEEILAQKEGLDTPYIQVRSAFTTTGTKVSCVDKDVSPYDWQIKSSSGSYWYQAWDPDNFRPGVQRGVYYRFVFTVEIKYNARDTYALVEPDKLTVTLDGTECRIVGDVEEKYGAEMKVLTREYYTPRDGDLQTITSIDLKTNTADLLRANNTIKRPTITETNNKMVFRADSYEDGWQCSYRRVLPNNGGYSFNWSEPTTSYFKKDNVYRYGAVLTVKDWEHWKLGAASNLTVTVDGERIPSENIERLDNYRLFVYSEKHQAHERTPIEKVNVTSNMASIVKLGGTVQTPTITFNDGDQALYIDDSIGFGWLKWEDSDWYTYGKGEFEPGKYCYYTNVHVGNWEEYAFSDNVTVNWDGKPCDRPTGRAPSQIFVSSPVYIVPETVEVVTATSSDIDSISKLGGAMTNPTFTVQTGQPARFRDNYPYCAWFKKVDGAWKECGLHVDMDKIFTEGTYRYCVYLFIGGKGHTEDRESYVFSPDSKVIVNGTMWETWGYKVTDTFSWLRVFSPEYTISAAPAAPVVTAGNSAVSGKPMLTWDAVDGATSYRVYRATSQNGTYSLLGSVTTTTYVNTGAKDGVTYYYKVTAVNDSGESAFSNIVSGQNKAVTPKPAAPVVKIGNSATSGKPMLTWNAVSGATSYKVYRATSQNGTYSLLGTVTATSYINTGAKDGVTYYYKVKAVNSAGESAYSNIVSGQSKAVTPKPAAPVVKIGHSASSGKPMLTWNAVDGAASYKVYRATSQNGTYSLLGSVTVTSYTNTGAKDGVTYYYKVKAVNSAGESPYSNIVSGQSKAVTPKPAAPVVKAGNSATSGKPILTWNAVDGAASYKVYRATAKNGAYSVINTTKALTYTNTGAALGTTYYYKVEALDAAGKSLGFSDVVEGKVAPVLAVGYSSVSGKPQLTWKAVPGATEYQVYRSTQQNSGYTKINTTTATSYVNTGAKANTTYYYKIVAVKGTAVSDFSNIVSARPSK